MEREPDMSLPTSVAGIEVSDAIILPPNPVVVQLNSIRKLKERRELEILETVNRMELSQNLSRCFVCAQHSIFLFTMCIVFVFVNINLQKNYFTM